jgi:aspartate/methionine/tyrosine aminotransferase
MTARTDGRAWTSPLALERWFDRHEHDADLMLAESGVRPLPVSRFDTDPPDLGYVIPTDGDPEFRGEVAARYGRDADEVTFTCGAQEANFLAVHALMDEGDHAVVVTPTYQSLYALPERIGSVTRVALDPPSGHSTSTPSPRRCVRRRRSSSSTTPTTRLAGTTTGRRCEPSPMSPPTPPPLVDEVYRELASEPHPPAASLGEHVYSTASPSKAYGLAGLRFGWFVGDAATVARANRWKDYTTISPGAFGHHLARQALGPMEDEILAESRALAERNREVVVDFLGEHRLTWHEPVGVNGFPTVPDGFDDAESFCLAVVEDASVVLAPGSAFGRPDRFRVGFGLPTEELREGLDRVSTVVAERT